MQTYTHLTLAGATAPLISEKPALMAVWVLGHIFPDLTLALQYIIDLLLKKKPLQIEPPAWVWIKNVLHSLFFALIFLIIGYWNTWSLLFGAGIAIHIVIDILTHSRVESNCVYAYPLKLESFCIWEYQIGKGILRPRPFELAINIISCVIILWYLS
jgi:hypothetical protein